MSMSGVTPLVCVVAYLMQLGVLLCVGVFCFVCGLAVMALGVVRSARCHAVVFCWVDRCFASWVLLGLFYLLRVTHHLANSFTLWLSLWSV